MTFISLFKSALVLLALLSFASCGSQSGGMLNNVDVKPELVDGEVFVSVSAELGIGNLVMPNVTIPVLKDGDEIGEVTMLTGADGKNELVIDLNVSALAKVDASSAELPNGNLLPLIGQNPAVAVSIKDKAKLYISLVDGNVVLGVAVGISSFDSMGRKIGTSSLFPIFNQGSVAAAGGIYTSKTAGQNGFGFFADLSGSMDADMLETLFQIQMQQDASVIDHRSIKPSKRAHRKINRELYKLHKKRAKLRLH